MSLPAPRQRSLGPQLRLSLAIRVAYALALLTLPVVMSGCLMWRRGGGISEALTAHQRLTRLGVSAMEAGDWHEAELRLREALAKSPSDPDIQRHLAETLCQLGEREEALEHMIGAAAAAPQDAAIAVRASELLLEAGRADEAAKLADHAVKLDAGRADAWAVRGRTRAALGQPEGAQADFQHSLLLAPNSSQVLMESAELYSRHGEFERCLATLHRLMDTYPPGEEPCSALLMEGKTYLALGRPQQAGESLQYAARRFPHTAELQYLRAEAKLALGRPAEAQQLAREALALDSQFAPAHEMLQRIATGAPQRVIK